MEKTEIKTANEILRAVAYEANGSFKGKDFIIQAMEEYADQFRVSQQLTREKIQEICQRYIRNSQDKHDAFLGTGGETARKNFKSGLAWGIDSMKQIEDELLCYTNDLSVSPDAQKEIEELKADISSIQDTVAANIEYIEELKSALTSKESAVKKAVEAFYKFAKHSKWCGLNINESSTCDCGLEEIASSLKSESNQSKS